MKQFQKITRQALLSLLVEFRKNISATGVAFGNVVYHTDESGSRTEQGKKMLQKITRVNITIGSNYEKRVNRDIERQGEEANFTAQPKNGMQYLNDEGVLLFDIKTGNKRYLAAIVENKTTPHTIYFHQNKPISLDKATAMDLLTPSFFADKKTAGRGNVSEDKDFHVINPNFDNIISLTLNKMKYIIED